MEKTPSEVNASQYSLFDRILYTCIIVVSDYFKVTLHISHLVHICKETISMVSALILLSSVDYANTMMVMDKGNI